MRASRASLKEIADSTAQYAGLAVAAAPGGAIGAPPLSNNALRVVVTNINELTAGGGRGLGAFIEGMFGGIGRFVGGFLGGLAGGVVGGAAQPLELLMVTRIVDTIGRLTPEIGRIVDNVRLLRGVPAKPAEGPPAEAINALEVGTQVLRPARRAPPHPRPGRCSRGCGRSTT